MVKLWLIFRSLFSGGGLSFKKKILRVVEFHLKGTIMIKQINKIRESSENSSFNDKLIELETKYFDLGFHLNFSDNKILIELFTPKKLILTNENYIDDFVNDLRDLFSLIPEKTYLISISIKGSSKNLLTRKNFIIFNKNEKIGINIVEVGNFSS